MSFARSRRAALAALAAALALLAAACVGGHPSASATTSTSLQAQWHRAVLCARAHGMPTLPDPTIDASGHATFPSVNKAQIPQETRTACQAMFDRLSPSGPNHGYTQAQLNELLKFARCMRSHGISDWPDPNASGEFPMPLRLVHLLKSAMRSQMMACERYNPDPQGRIYGTHP